MKKAILFLFLSLILLSSCSYTNKQSADSQIKITASIFPQYDFAYQIAGDCAEVTMLIPPGSESHTFEPSPKDIISIEQSDVFIYTGGESDSWIEEILKTINNDKLITIALTDICETIDTNHSHSENIHTVDEHVWTSPKNAMQISKKIAEILSEIDNKNSEIYKSNLLSYLGELEALDNCFDEISQNAKRNLLIFADRFPFRYLTEAYSLHYESAFHGCAEETEPDISTVVSLIETVKSENIPVIFYNDFSNHKLADSISEETGAKAVMLRTCHTVTADELSDGITYIDLMSENAKKIKEALN